MVLPEIVRPQAMKHDTIQQLVYLDKHAQNSPSKKKGGGGGRLSSPIFVMPMYGASCASPQVTTENTPPFPPRSTA